MAITVEQIVVAVFVVVGVFALSIGMGIVSATDRYILYLKQRDDMRQIRKERGREYLVCAYFLKTDTCVLGSVVLLEPPRVGETLLLGHKDDPVICIGKVTDVATIAEPDPEHKAVWVMLDQEFMYTQLMEQVEGWQRKNRIHPRV